jgi:hypothetical protein
MEHILEWQVKGTYFRTIRINQLPFVSLGGMTEWVLDMFHNFYIVKNP